MNEITKVIDAKGNETKITYDLAGRRTSIDNPDAGLTSFRYDAAGNLTVKITPNTRKLGTSIKYVYTYNRLERVAYPGMNDVFYAYGEAGESYNRAGRLKSVDNGTVKDMLYYGKFGEMVKQERTIMVPAATGSVAKTYTMKYRYDNFGRMRYQHQLHRFCATEIGAPSTVDALRGTRPADCRLLWLRYNRRFVCYQHQPHRRQATESAVQSTVPALTYTFDYKYESSRPHAVTSTGVQNFTYDASGNMLTCTDIASNAVRHLAWDDENRLISVVDPTAKTEFAYDHSGMRVIKSGATGTVEYVSTNYTVRNGEIASSHIFVGNTRVATKVISKTDNKVKDIYFYGSDHLGSSSVITTRFGGFHELLEYFPYGETWVEEKVASGEVLPWKFTGAEKDSETGLYYHGHRYRDPRLGGWLSVDPALGEYLPTGNKNKDSSLPGMG